MGFTYSHHDKASLEQVHIFILNLTGEGVTTLCKYGEKTDETVNGITGKKKQNKETPKIIIIIMMLDYSRFM